MEFVIVNESCETVFKNRTKEVMQVELSTAYIRFIHLREGRLWQLSSRY